MIIGYINRVDRRMITVFESGRVMPWIIAIFPNLKSIKYILNNIIGAYFVYSSETFLILLGLYFIIY